MDIGLKHDLTWCIKNMVFGLSLTRVSRTVRFPGILRIIVVAVVVVVVVL